MSLVGSIEAQNDWRGVGSLKFQCDATADFSSLCRQHWNQLFGFADKSVHVAVNLHCPLTLCVRGFVTHSFARKRWCARK